LIEATYYLRWPGKREKRRDQNSRRARAYLKLLRWSGLRAGDAACLAKHKLRDDDSLFLYQAKVMTSFLALWTVKCFSTAFLSQLASHTGPPAQDRGECHDHGTRNGRREIKCSRWEYHSNWSIFLSEVTFWSVFYCPGAILIRAAMQRAGEFFITNGNHGALLIVLGHHFMKNDRIRTIPIGLYAVIDQLSLKIPYPASSFGVGRWYSQNHDCGHTGFGTVSPSVPAGPGNCRTAPVCPPIRAPRPGSL